MQWLQVCQYDGSISLSLVPIYLQEYVFNPSQKCPLQQALSTSVHDVDMVNIQSLAILVDLNQYAKLQPLRHHSMT